MAQDDFGNEIEEQKELLPEEQVRAEYALSWCLAEAEDYISLYGQEKFLSELRKRLEQ